MLKTSFVATVVLVGLTLWCVPASQAQTFFTLSNCPPTSSCGTSPFGSVTLLQSGSSSVIVTVTLTPTGDRFSGNDVLTFDLSGLGSVAFAHTGTDDLSLTTGTFNQTPFGSFSFAVNCTGPMSMQVCNGSHTSSTNTESFTLTRTGGLSISSFIPNSAGYLFTSDITVPSTGHSGIVAATTPEPASMLLFGTGLLVVAGIFRRRRPEGASA